MNRPRSLDSSIKVPFYLTLGIISISTFLFLLPSNLVLNWNDWYSKITSMLMTSAVNYSGIARYFQIARDYGTLIGLLVLFLLINRNESQINVKKRALVYSGVMLLIPLAWSFTGRGESVGLSTIMFAGLGCLFLFSIESLNKFSLLVSLGILIAVVIFPTYLFSINLPHVDYTSHLVVFSAGLVSTMFLKRLRLW